MNSPSPFIPPRPLSSRDGTPAPSPPVIPPFSPPQSPPQQQRGRQQAGGVPVYPGLATPYMGFNQGSPGSYYIAPQTLPFPPQGVPDTPMAPVGSGGLAPDWTGFPTPGPGQAGGGAPTPQTGHWGLPGGYNTGQAPATGYAAYTPLPAGFGMTPMQPMQPMHPMQAMQGMPGMAGVAGIPAMHMGGMPTSGMGWHPGPGPGVYPTPYAPNAPMPGAWGYTPYPPPGATLPPVFGPPPPLHPGAPRMDRRQSSHRRARSTERMDVFNKWFESPSYGPVLSPMLIKETDARLELNPLIMPLDAPARGEDHNDSLEWDMLFHTGRCHCSSDPAGRSWSQRNPPATWPRVSSLRLVSGDFPWVITIDASNPENGVTCGDVLEGVHSFLHQRVSSREYAATSPDLQRQINATYYHNRSTAPGVPGGLLRPGIHRFDFLGTSTMFGGIAMNEQRVREICKAPLPCTFELICGQRPDDYVDVRDGRRSRSGRSRATSRATSRPPTRPPSRGRADPAA
ncbi:unnamed protein product [Somion occarium]|uniref:DUF6699 domain-containing protein n=1 Tax=Somion occarium TaxID=3059160 RepID=A0ABP1D5V5_9APHY